MGTSDLVGFVLWLRTRVSTPAGDLNEAELRMLAAEYWDQQHGED